MKGHSHPKNDVSLNPSSNPSIRDVIDSVAATRRQFVKGGVGAAALSAAGGLTLGGLVGTVHAAPVPAGPGFPGIGFESIPASTATNGAVADEVRVPPGYTAGVLVAWGDAIMPGGTAFVGDASETAAQQAKQYGEHTDGMHFFPFAGTAGAPSSDRGLLCANNEYTHEAILYATGSTGSSLRRVHHRDPPQQRQVDRGERFGLRPSPDGQYPDAHRRPGRRPCPDEGEELFRHRHRHHRHGRHHRRHHRVRHGQQLRPRHHALGHLPDL